MKVNNMALKLKNIKKLSHLSMSGKLVISVLAIVAILLVSAIITVIEFRRMTNQVGRLVNDYNRQILVAVDRADSVVISAMNPSTDCADMPDSLYEAGRSSRSQLDSLMDSYNAYIEKTLEDTTVRFDENFYRSIMPGTVGVLAGIVLSLLLLFFILIYYVRPLGKMVGGLNIYRQFGHPYRNHFEGDDQLKSLDEAIADLVDENINLRKKARKIEQ